MSAIAICTDSSALFVDGETERLGIAVVPIALTVDGEPFDERAHDVDAFYARLAGGATVTTSQPSPGDFPEVYGCAVADGASEVLSLHLDSRISGTVASAELAAREAPVPVTVVDTGTASFGVGACARAAAEAVADGASRAEATALARDLGSCLRDVFVAQAAPGGRADRASGWVLLELVDGAIRRLGAARTEDEAAALMAERIASSDWPARAAVGHAAAVTRPAADALARQLSDSASVVIVERYRVVPAVGAHTGSLSFGAFWWPTEPLPAPGRL